ncbi:ABC transporter permease [bacterium]|nr:ABC transporter permease [bacterium]
MRNFFNLRRWFQTPRPPLAEAWTRLELLGLLIQRDLSARYKKSVLGNLWPLLNQLSQLLIYTYVFSVVLQVKVNLQEGQADSPMTFGLWLFAGLIPWIALSTSLGQACIAVTNQPNLVKKVVFPLALLPLVPVGVAFLESTLGLMLLLTFIALFLGQIHVTLLLLPLVWVVQLLLTAGLSYWGAGLTVFLRDIPQLVAIGLNLWFYATPVIYPASLIPEPFVHWVFWLNPMAAIVEMYRDTVLLGQVTHWAELGLAGILSTLIFVSGVWIYNKLRPGFADVL